MSDWVNRSIKDLCVAIVDCVNKTAPSQTVPTPFKMLRTTNVRNGWVNTTNVSFVDEDTYARWTRRMVPTRGDVILTREAPFGDLGMLRTDEQVFLGQRLVMYRADESKCDPHFLMYSMMGPVVQAELRSLGSGSTVEHLRVPDCEKITIPTPPLPVQRQIGSILRSIDDLIENNRRRVSMLEAMARAIYREWFVKFRYPGYKDVPLVDSALGSIPKGWTVQPLKSVAAVNKSSRKPKDNEVIRYLDISALSEREVGELEPIAGADAPGRARRELQSGDTVWTTVRPNRRAHALVVAPGDDWIASTGLAVLTPTAVSSAFLFEMTSTTAFSDWLVGRATGSAYPAVRANDFEEAAVVVPDAAVDAAFADKVAPMHELSWKLRAQSSQLAQIRDLLLPKLVTGKVDVSGVDLDALVGESVA